ncbi:cystatin-B-like isoform X2 [Dendropsophus ebraccatus]|uniref:cystatin-B-like isoform X2 n=1 Tax=Dendropsophus ebraccatus TaxID=150705 RepID=UPI0038314D0F
MKMPLCGGLGGVKPATDAVQALCEQVKPTVEEKHGKKYTTFVATEYKTQLVAGTNYFVKVHVGDEEYLHLRMYKTLPHDGEKLSLTAVQAGKTKQEEIVHFD